MACIINIVDSGMVTDRRKVQQLTDQVIYSSSSSSPPSSFLAAAAARLRLTRPGRPPPYGEVRAKSMCFWESRRTTKEGTLTICFPTLKTHQFRNRSTFDERKHAPDVTLPYEHTSVVNGFSETALEDLCLQTPLQEILNLKGQHVIKTHTSFVEHTNSDKTTD